jgi:hypothetical protein
VQRPAATHQNHAANDVGDGGESSEDEGEKHFRAQGSGHRAQRSGTGCG